MQQVDRREGGRRLARRLLLRARLRALELAQRPLRVARARGALLLQVLLHALGRLGGGGARVLVVRVGRARLVVRAQQEVQRRDAQRRVRAEERARHHVDRARVAPHVPAVELDEHAQRVLGGHDRAVVEHREDVRLQPPVERVVLVLGVDALDVGDDVRVQPLAQDLVAAAEAAEAELQQREGLMHPAVPQQHQRLEDGAAHGRVERVELVIEERGELCRDVGGELREARAHGRDEAEQGHQLLRLCAGLRALDVYDGLEVAQPPLEVLLVAVRVSLDQVLKRGQRLVVVARGGGRPVQNAHEPSSGAVGRRGRRCRVDSSLRRGTLDGGLLSNGRDFA